MRKNTMSVLKRSGAVALLLVLAACGSGLGTTSSSTTNGSGNTSGGGNNNTPPGIPNSIVFVTPPSTNTVIGLQGTGANTNADVTFQVNDASSVGVAGVAVTFALIPNTGDASLTTTTGTTDANGKVSTFVVSGNEHYSVTVQATVTTPSGVKTANSNSLTISTGIPTENNFAMAATNLTANNADDTLGVTDTITVQLSDRFNNPAPDGTAVSFTTNSGQIPGQCLTVGGSCTVIWTSSGLPNPLDGHHLAGRVEILAYTVGEESFTDVDGDGVFDNSDKFTTFQSGTTIDAFTETSNPSVDDIGEVFMDETERSESINPLINTAAYQAGDFFHDFNNDNVRNGPDGHFYGFGCKGTPTVPCGNTTTKEIGKQICVEMSTTGALFGISAGTLGSFNTTTNTLTVGAGNTVTFAVSDTNGQALAKGTTVTLVSSGLNGFTVNQPPSLPFTYPDTGCGAAVAGFTVGIVPVSPAPPGALTGQILLKVITPGAGGGETDSVTITLVP